MIVKLLTENHLEFLSLKGGCRGSSESTHVIMPHCWTSHALAHIAILITYFYSFVKKVNLALIRAILYLMIKNH